MHRYASIRIKLDALGNSLDRVQVEAHSISRDSDIRIWFEEMTDVLIAIEDAQSKTQQILSRIELLNE